MKAFLFELNNAIRAPQFKEVHDEAAKGSKGKLTAEEYAKKTVELEVEGMLRLGEVWAATKKASGKGSSWDKYDSEFYAAEYEAFKKGTKTKDKIVTDVLGRVYPAETGASAGKTVKQFYMEQYTSMSGGK
jgi:hypothetical protein